MKTDKSIKRRKRIRGLLESILEKSKLICGIMERLPHKQGNAVYRSLKDNSGEGIVHTNGEYGSLDGFGAVLRSPNGELYKVQIYKVDGGKGK